MELRNIAFSPPDIQNEEIEEVVDTLKSGWITTGPKTKLFEKNIANYTNTEKAVCVNSATAGMELTLRVLGIKAGDEVITTAYTYSATAAVINHVGAKIILVDTQKDSLEMDYSQLEAAITEKTKAVMAVDIAGIMCDYEKIKETVNNKISLYRPNTEVQEKLGRIALIADAAHSLGANREGVSSGQAADFTVFSFHAVKNLTTSEGGAVVWNNELDSEWLYRQYNLYSLHGQSKDALSKSQKGAWEYDILTTGYKSNMTDISASIGIHQLKRYDSILEKRKMIINKFNKAFNEMGIETLDHYNNTSNSSGHLYMTRVSGINEGIRNKIIVDLAHVGVNANVHYKPLPMLTAYKELGFTIKDFPNSYDMYSNEITLPLHTLLSDEDIRYIIYQYKNIVKRHLNV